MPPPRARSNSSMPVGWRSASLASISASVATASAGSRPRPARIARLGAALGDRLDERVPGAAAAGTCRATSGSCRRIRCRCRSISPWPSPIVGGADHVAAVRPADPHDDRRVALTRDRHSGDRPRLDATNTARLGAVRVRFDLGLPRLLEHACDGPHHRCLTAASTTSARTRTPTTGRRSGFRQALQHFAITSGTDLAAARFSPGEGEIDALAAAPIPEPETYALFAAGLAALGFMTRRRRERR